MKYRTRIGKSILVLAAMLAATAIAAERQDASLARETAERFLKTQTAGLPGQATIHVNSPDARLKLAPCASFETFLPPGSRAFGKTTVGVRCVAPTAWTIYLPATVRVIGEYVSTAAALAPGQTLAPADLAIRTADLGGLPADTLTRMEDGVGMRLVSGLAAGTPLRRTLLRPPRAVQQGQTVSLVVNAEGFEIRSEGRALANADLGQNVSIRTPGGQIVSGIARAGQVVDIPF